MPINDLNNGGAVQDPNAGYNYALQQAIIKRQRDMAIQQQGTQMPEGKMVSGWYVAPHASQYLAAGLDKMLGAYQMTKADQAEKDNNIKSQQVTSELANRLANLKGAQTGVTYDPSKPEQVGPPQTAADGSQTFGTGGQAVNQYAAPTFNDKMPIYQQLQQTGQFGQLVAQKEMEKDLAGPSYQKLGQGETLLQFDKSGRQTGSITGQAKQTEFDKRLSMLKDAYPNLPYQTLVAVANKDIDINTETGIPTNKITGQRPDYGQAAPQAPTNFPKAVAAQGQQQISVPPRGQTLSGPAPSNFPQTVEQALAEKRKKAEVLAAEKVNVELAPKVKTAQDGLASLDQLSKMYDELETMLSSNGHNRPMTTGHVRALFADKTSNVFDNATQDRFESLVKNLSLNTIQAMPGMTSVFNSNEEGKRLNATLPNRAFDNKANLDNITAARSLLSEKKRNLLNELNGYTGKPAINTEAASSYSADELAAAKAEMAKQTGK